MNKISLMIDTVIQRLGYKDSSNLFYYSDISKENGFTLHTIKIIQELKPYAFYSIESKPFILFYNYIDNKEDLKSINKKIWNSQIPISIFCEEDSIRILNGSSLNLEDLLLSEVLHQPIEECNEFSPFSYWEVTNPNFWGDYIDKYSVPNLNTILLENIEYLTECLKYKYNITFSIKLVLRLIFIRYLIDRGVDLGYKNFTNNVEESKPEFIKVAKEKDQLYELFVHLKDKFNGNLFDLGDEINDTHLTKEVFVLLSDFLAGNMHLQDGQYSLFPLYDFNIIPVELISNIYEILLGKETQQNDKAFYTPSYLVDYILGETINVFLVNNNTFKVLDPACGSGIFLVDCYRRIIEKNFKGVVYPDNDERLKEILVNNIFGIDTNEEAIDVTIFSLYLTILDHKDPKTLDKFKLPNLKNKNLFISDFFDDSKLISLQDKSFDFIIGNPPWGNVKKGLHLKYCKDNKKPQQNAEISRSFIYRVKDFSSANTQACFIVPSKILYNQKLPARQFRKYLLENTEIKKIVELSSVRKLVFKNADAPAAILMFKYTDNHTVKNRMTYISIKPNVFFKLFNIIVIEKTDIKFIDQDILLENDWIWKTLVYGTNWDIDIIAKLRKKYPSLATEIKQQSPKLIVGAGVEYQDGDKKDASHLLNKPMLDSYEAVGHFYINAKQTTLFSKTRIHRPRNRKLFEPPYCLIPTGVDCSNYKMRAAYSEETFISKKTMYIIKGVSEQKNWLMNVVGYMNSSLYAYLNFLLGSSIGIEREQRFMDEVIQFPFIYDENISKKVLEIQEAYLLNPKEIGIDTNIIDLDNYILNLFALQDNPFVDYITNIQIPLVANASKITPMRIVNEMELLKYSECFKDYFENIYKKTHKYIKITIYPSVFNRYTIFELAISDNSEENIVTISNTIDDSKMLFTKLMAYKSNDMFYQIRDAIYFDEASFYIIKTNEYKNWHPAIALVDLSEIIDQILSNNKEEVM